jgi:TM2 domain-containing membrane protein YozV
MKVYPVGTALTGAGTPAAPATPYILNSAAGTNLALILTGTSGLHAFYATNTGAAVAYVKLYNKAAAPVLASDVPAMIMVVPAAVGGVPGVCTLPIGFQGFRFALGLGIAITGGAADTDATAVAAGQVKVMLSRTV